MGVIQYYWVSDAQLGRLKEIGAALDDPELAAEFIDLVALVAMQRLQVHVHVPGNSSDL
jgi:hypothetical protein